MVQDLGTTNGRQSLYTRTLQKYWIMKHILARAMTLHQEKMEGEVVNQQERNKELEHDRREIMKELATIEIQTYRNNLALGHIEQTLP